MLFCSVEFLFVFLPVVMAGYYLLGARAGMKAAKAWLVAASFLFYGWNEPWYLLVISSSVAVNYLVVHLLGADRPAWQRRLLCLGGVVFNLGLLGYFKYSAFLVETTAQLIGAEWFIRRVALPLGISFFTFQQISCVVDLFREPPADRKHYSLLDYLLFVTFFPQLVAGPIVHHEEMMPQFEKPGAARPDDWNLACGLHLFAIGLFKKLVLADFFAIWSDTAYAMNSLNFWQAWTGATAYMFQLYFDFSAYSDMAIGLGRMFNIRLPVNFNSPLKSTSIQDFWQRWHMTLGRFLMTYLYFPLGGSRRGNARAYLNLFIVFLLCGVWHGASWLFIIWGVLNGLGMVLHRFWKRRNLAMPPVLGWCCMTFFFLTSLVLVRSPTWERATSMLHAMFSPVRLADLPTIERILGGSPWQALLLLAAWVLVLACPNSIQLNDNFQPSRKLVLFTALLLILSVLHLSRISPFIYFNF